jgi:phosphate starvation-inducible PhoH-like protein
MKMFLTRIGFGSVAVVTGDVTQIDLPRSVKSGLRDAIEVLHDVDGISFTFFTAKDVVRHPLVQRIVRAYERREAMAGEKGEGRKEKGEPRSAVDQYRPMSNEASSNPDSTSDPDA